MEAEGEVRSPPGPSETHFCAILAILLAADLLSHGSVAALLKPRALFI